MDNICNISGLRNCFNLKETRDIYNILLRAGNKYGIKVLYETDEKTFISKELFDTLKQYKENISDSVPSIDTIRENATNSVPFKDSKYVYYLLDGNDLIYIGLTTNPARRIGQHITTKPVTRAFCIETEDYEILESFSINQYMPELNVQKLNSLGLFEVCAFNCIRKL